MNATVTSTNNPTWRTKWLGLDEGRHPEIEAMATEAEGFIRRCLRSADPAILVIHGRNGTGKSHTARQIIRAVSLLTITAYSLGRCPRPLTCAQFPWSILSGMEPHDRTAETIWVDAIEADLLLLDDVGSETDQYRGGRHVENLRIILEERRRRWTILTTNIPPAHWAEVWDHRVEDRLHRNAIHVGLPTAPAYLPRS